MGDDSSVSFGMQWIIINKQSKERWIPDANQWSYTNLLKQNGISEATQWTYTNLLKKKNKDEIWKSTANLSGLRLTPHMIIGKPMPHYRDLQWILTYKNRSNT